ncbi:MAG: hypothetical protein IPK19_25595 [Chloroflexi bacterium]|nr:hypothetical protein [Chloroflexota bacterium]
MRHKGPVNSAEMLPDGRIMTWSDDGTVRLWTVDLAVLRAWADSLPVYPLTAEERAEFFLPPLTATPAPG